MLDLRGLLRTGLLAVLCACANSVPPGMAVVETDRRSMIVQVDAKETRTRRIAVPGGHHEFAFEIESDLLLLKPRCTAAHSFREGTLYRHTGEIARSRLPGSEARGHGWRRYEAASSLREEGAAPGTAPTIALTCKPDCLVARHRTFMNCQRYRAIHRIEESCVARDTNNVRDCVSDSTAMIMGFRRKPGVYVLYIPGPEADYSREGHDRVFETCTSRGKPRVEECLREHGWEAVL